MVVCHKEVTWLLHMLGVVDPTQVFVVRAPRVFSSVVRLAFHAKVSKNMQGNGIGGVTSRLYAISNHLEQEDSLDVFTGMIQVFYFTVYALPDPRECLSFVSPYVAMNFNIIL